MLNYRHELDGIRGIAVLSVILAHAQVELFSGGFIGVDIFFVLSGYLITKIISDELVKNEFSFNEFYRRRAKRILPALYVVIIITIPFSMMWMLPHQLENNAKNISATLLFLSNFLLKQNDYFDLVSEEKPFLHTWSLAVEEQFYLLFPILLFLITKKHREHLFRIVLLLVILSLLIAEFGWRTQPIANFYLLPGRAWELLTGASIALLPSPRPSKTITTISLHVIVITILMANELTPSPSVYVLPAVFATAMLIIFYSKESLAGKILTFRPLVLSGLTSYSAYLLHQPLFALARIRLNREPSEVEYFGLITLTMILAYFSWRLIETPFRRTIPWSITKTLIFLLSITLLGFCYFVLKNDGYPDRFEKKFLGDTGHSTFNKHLSNFDDCLIKKYISNDALRCKSTMHSAVDIILLGDSHAEHLFPGFVKNLPSKNIRYYALGIPSIYNPNFSQIFSALQKDQPALVFISIHYYGRRHDTVNLKKDLESTVSKLLDIGHKVILLNDIPSYRIHAANCAYAINGTQTRECLMKPSNYTKQKDTYENTLRELAKRKNVSHLSLDEIFCGNDGCSMTIGENIFYRDGNHLNLNGSQLVVNHILDRIPEEHISKGLNEVNIK